MHTKGALPLKGDRRRPITSVRRRHGTVQPNVLIEEYGDVRFEEDAVEEHALKEHDIKQEEEHQNVAKGGFPRGLVDALVLTHYIHHVAYSIWQSQPSNEDALHSPLQVGGNSHVQDEHEQDENQDTLLEVEQKRPPTHKGAWLVDVIDDQCKMTTKHLKTNDVWNLSQNEKIIVHWNEEYQPIGDGGALLNRFLGSIARNFKAKFVVNSDIQINYILKALNHKWRDCRLELWQQRDDGTRTRDELIAMAPESIDRDHWASFVDYRLDERTKEKIQTYESTTSSQSKEISSLDSLAHVLGSQEHCGRVRGLGLGPYPSKVFGVHARSHIGSSSSTPSNVELQSQVSSLTSQVNEMKAIMTLLLQNHQGPLPS
ncbi:hypothetical protein LR48_Vigan01g007600 [Vigna angularis]|uniref:Uncharacterized protein n=1 Tax=Phaseolus angularis TaxID=3914 RepID=A0A0L9TJD2_PHAAN|nr:hypothetical protein LR48_Vigan01g007600 [Vigna angularis]